MQATKDQVPLWRQLQGAAAVVESVLQGRSMTPALETIDLTLRPGVQALSFQVLRCLGRAQALRQALVQRTPEPKVDALLCVVLALLASQSQKEFQVREKRGKNAHLDRADPLAAAEQAAVSAQDQHVQESVDRRKVTGFRAYDEHTLVNQGVEAAKRQPKMRHQANFINGCLRRFLREQEALMLKTDQTPQARWNHPLWWIDRVRQDHPVHWQAILRANNARAPLTLRVNRRKTTPAEYVQLLQAVGLQAFCTGEHGVVLAVPCAVADLPKFAQGYVSVQDAAAQLAAPLLLNGLLPAGATSLGSAATLPPNQPQQLRILDACAAPGGKTAHVLELADAQVTALDVDALRCQRMAQNLQRLGLQAQIKTADAGRPQDWWNGQLYDGILLDAPCTASGIVRRHPDIPWLRRPGDIAQLAILQAQLLGILWPLLRVGGRLVYCTCSVFKAEGEQQAQLFVAQHANAVVRVSPGYLQPTIGDEDGLLQEDLMHDHDGFYYAVYEKIQG